MNLYLRLLYSLLLVISILHFAGGNCAHGQTIDFKPPEVALYERSGLPLTAFKAASDAALDSLSRRYGIPLEASKQDSRHYRFALASQITPNLAGLKTLKMYSRFPYKNTILLCDAANMREVMRVENYPKDLLKISQNADSLISYYIKLYQHSFNLMSGYGYKAQRHSPAKNIAFVVFDSAVPSGDLARIKDVVKDVLVKNQEVMRYKVTFVQPNESPLSVCKIKVRIAESKESRGIKVGLSFPDGSDLDYHGNPIPTEFVVNGLDRQTKDFSFLLAKMTATLYKFAESNFK